MMLPTHALVGLAFAFAVVTAMPEFGGIVLLAGVLGGVFPDLDLYFGHRRTLHYPVYYPVLLLLIVPLAVALPTTVTVAAGVFVLAAAGHSIADAFGGGLELRPWERTSERAVYDHHRNRWLPPRRWIRYDGAPEDLLLSVVVGLPLVIGLEGPYQGLVVGLLGLALGYTLVRRRLPQLATLIVADVLQPTLPALILGRVPDRYLNDGHSRPPDPPIGNQ